MKKLAVIDGNSILNRAFYGIMGSKMLQTADGTFTNAVYGFLSILFKLEEDLKPDYLAVAFDVKHPTKRHELYKDYKGTRKGMPDELAAQMPIIKDVLTRMNITIIEKPGYEADDILGTLAKYAEKQGVETVLLTGDRDSFQLASDKITIRIPRTKNGKTETEDYDRKKILEEYGLEPESLIDVKGLQGDTSDNIPGVPGIGEKTAIGLIKEHGSIEKIYELLEKGEGGFKGKQKENLESNKDLAFLSKVLGTIDTNAPIDKELSLFEVKEWDRKAVLEIFKYLRFNRYIDRFDLEKDIQEEDKLDSKDLFEHVEVTSDEEIKELLSKIETAKEMFYYFELEDRDVKGLIIKQKIKYINIYQKDENKVYSVKFSSNLFKSIFENPEIEKNGHELKRDYILLKQVGITMENLKYDAKIAAYLLNAVTNAYKITDIASEHLDIDLSALGTGEEKEEELHQESFFDMMTESSNEETEKVGPAFINAASCYVIYKSKDVLIEKLKEIESLELFEKIEMPTVEALASMQWEGIFIDEKELVKFGDHLKKNLEELRIDIYKLSGEEFNVNSTKQLGEVLFEKLNLPVIKKTKSGYSTDVETLEKLREHHPIIDKILEYRQIQKLNSTYVEGMIPHININTGRIHTFFHQTVTATGRLSSTEPNLQNIPTRTELGKKLRKVFKAEKGNIFLDADYSQIELRVLAHMSEDKIMVDAFNEDQDIHTICASQIFNVPVEEVSKQLRSRAKAVNFGIVYGISDFGLSEQVGIKRNEAKEYITAYLEKYSGIDNFMKDVVEDAKKKGYVTTLLGRRRYIPELSSNNYMVRKFGDRAAMNTPIQGTAADIMKIAMIDVYNELKKRKLKSKLVLQIHDELLIDTVEKEKEEVKELLKTCMERAMVLKVPLKVEVEEGKNWFQAK